MQNNVRSNINIDTFRVGKKCCGLRNYFLVLVIIALPAQVLFLVHWFTRSRGIIFQNKFILYLYLNLLRTQNRTITFFKKRIIVFFSKAFFLLQKRVLNKMYVAMIWNKIVRRIQFDPILKENFWFSISARPFCTDV